MCCAVRALSVSVYKIVRVDIDNSAQRQAMPVLMENVWKFGNDATARANDWVLPCVRCKLEPNQQNTCV